MYLSIVRTVQQTTRANGHSTNRQTKNDLCIHIHFNIYTFAFLLIVPEVLYIHIHIDVMYTYTLQYIYFCISIYAFVYLLIVPEVQQTKEQLHTALTKKKRFFILYTKNYIPKKRFFISFCI